MEKRKVRFEVEQVEQGGWGGGEGKGVDRDCTEMAGRAQGERMETALCSAMRGLRPLSRSARVARLGAPLRRFVNSARITRCIP